jgi:hypothetical protein
MDLYDVITQNMVNIGREIFTKNALQFMYIETDNDVDQITDILILAINNMNNKIYYYCSGILNDEIINFAFSLDFETPDNNVTINFQIEKYWDRIKHITFNGEYTLNTENVYHQYIYNDKTGKDYYIFQYP